MRSPLPKLLSLHRTWLAVNKPPNTLSIVPNPGESKPSVFDHLPALAPHTPKFFPVHRLDFGTSGVQIVARTPQAAAHLSGQFFSAHEALRKTYLALVHGHPQRHEGAVTTPIFVNSGGKNSRRISDEGKPSETRYRTVERFHFFSGKFTLVELHLVTGRMHQARIHMFNLGHSVVFDRRYKTEGAKKAEYRLPSRPDHQLLHAKSLEFLDPDSGEAVSVTAPLPTDFEHLLFSLKKC